MKNAHTALDRTLLCKVLRSSGLTKRNYNDIRRQLITLLNENGSDFTVKYIKNAYEHSMYKLGNSDKVSLQGSQGSPIVRAFNSTKARTLVQRRCMLNAINSDASSLKKAHAKFIKAVKTDPVHTNRKMLDVARMSNEAIRKT